MAGEKGTVCVTGAGGYMGSWLVKLLLSNDYTVHGTVRDPSDNKNSHLSKLEKASENLKLFKADLLDYDSFCTAIRGCDGVFHLASPVPANDDDTVEIVEPAVQGTINVLKACSEVNVNRVVLVSSVAAVGMNPYWPKGQVMDETSWSDNDFCIQTDNYYCLSKTEAERQAWEYTKKSGIKLVTLCPTLVWGPLLQRSANSSSLFLIDLLKEAPEKIPNNKGWYVDVRDVVEALLMLYEKPEAEGRYICSGQTIYKQNLVEILRRLFPNYAYPKSYTPGVVPVVEITTEKLEKLGWRHKSLEETIIDSIKSYRQAGFLD